MQNVVGDVVLRSDGDLLACGSQVWARLARLALPHIGGSQHVLSDLYHDATFVEAALREPVRPGEPLVFYWGVSPTSGTSAGYNFDHVSKLVNSDGRVWRFTVTRCGNKIVLRQDPS